MRTNLFQGTTEQTWLARACCGRFGQQRGKCCGAVRRLYRVKSTVSRTLLPSVFLLVVFACLVGAAQTRTQTFTLQRGWNAVYLEVTPADGAPATLFAGLPVASVWTRVDKLSAVAFVQDPSEPNFNAAGWLKWYPAPQPEFLSDLRELQGRRAVLLNLTNGPMTWQVTGQAVLRQIQWVTDAWNLRGFPIDPEHPPTFRAYFQASANHYDTARGGLRGVYRLGANGAWTVPTAESLMQPGEAYWVYCQGASSFTGPLELKLGSGERLEFGENLERIRLEFRNLASGSRTVTISQSEPVAKLFAYEVFSESAGPVWADLPNPFTFSVADDAAKTLSIALRRSQMPKPSYASILNITDGQGTRYTVPVTADKAGLNYAGLWVGSVTVNAISEPHFGSLTTNLYALIDGKATALTDPGLVVTTNQVQTTDASGQTVTTNQLVVQTTGGAPLPVYEKVERNLGAQVPTATASEFTMRLLIHVDAAGQSRLLKEVVQMWRDGTYTNDTAGNRVLEKPGTYVLVTEDALLSRFKGATLREGVPVGRRLSAIGFDFDGQGTNQMLLSGTFAPGGSLAGEIRIAPDYPLNPFRHKYHPDHDNLDADYEPITDPTRAESYPVTRALQFDLGTAPASSSGNPDPAYSLMEGVYRETLTGLHKQPILVQGTFRLARASLLSELNPSPTP